MKDTPKHLYTIPAGVPFADALAEGILTRYGDVDDPLALARVRILVPTRRAVRSVSEAFTRQSETAGLTALVLPQIQPIGDVDEEILIFDPGAGRPVTADIDDKEASLPPSVPMLRRQFQLMQLVVQWSKKAQKSGLDIGAAGPAQAALLAAELGRLIDLLETEGVSPSALQDLVSDPYAEYWAQTLDFLKIVIEHWPAILEEQGFIGQAKRQDMLLRRLADLWRAAPPQDPIIAAGSTGSIPATANLLGVIAGLPQGAVVLPGLDRAIDDVAWSAIDPAHPQFGMKELLGRLGAERHLVEDWECRSVETAPSSARMRRQVINEALRPAQVTDDWRLAIEQFKKDNWTEGLKGLSYIEAANEGEEALVIALMLREVAEKPGASAALVTPDRALGRRVAAQLLRWGIAIDDSAGKPLGHTQIGVFLRLITEVFSSDVAPLPLLSVLKHPLCGMGLPRATCRSLAREFELFCLRGPRPAAGLEGLRKRFDAACTDHDGHLNAKKQERLSSFLERIETCLSPFMALAHKKEISFLEILKAHIHCAEAMASESEKVETAPALWQGDEGEAASHFMASLLEEAPHLDVMRGQDYFPLFETLLMTQTVRPRFGLHPRLSIWGPMEARLQQADLIILGGLNEGTWPAETQVDAWLNRPMRAQLKLPLPERRIGLAAHDFAQLASAPQVVLTRPDKMAGVPQVASRWLLRLMTLLRGAQAEDMLRPEKPYLDWVRALQEAPAYRPISKPAPCPPLSARPRRFSVTEIETWIRDPYAIYAKKILKLLPLPALDEAPDQRDRGIVIHDILDRFISEYKAAFPHEALERLLEIGDEAFATLDDRPSIRAFWWPRFVRIAQWFIESEPARREEAMPFKLEVEGELSLKAPGGAFILKGRADRIDKGPEGLVIYDYKTGAVPSSKEVETQFAPQMPLEAVMAQQGAFEGIEGSDVAKLCYIALKGGEPPGEEHFVPGKSTSIQELVEQTLAGLQALILEYDLEETCYLSRPRVQFQSRGQDYDHLARVAEWSAASGDNEGGEP